MKGLEIGAPGGAADPWLRVAEAHLNISPWQLVCGHAQPTETVVRGITLRILRRVDGSLELADLIRGPDDSHQADAGHGSCPLSRLSLRIKDAQVTVIDVPTNTRLEFRDVAGRATSEERNATIQELRGSVNGGTFEVVAQLDRSTAAPAFEGHLRAQGLALNAGMSALEYLVPLLAGKSARLDGRLDVSLYLRGQGATRAALARTVVGHGTVHLDPIALDGSSVVDALAGYVDLPPQGRVGSVTSDFAITQGRILSDNLTLQITRLPIVLSGWTNFDGRVNYRLKSESLLERLPARARDLLADLAIDASDLSTLKIDGSLAAPNVTLEGIPLNREILGGRNGNGSGADGGNSTEDRQRLRELGRRLKDRILR
jgi:AsmA protein